jgi:hypothetical protein
MNRLDSASHQLQEREIIDSFQFWFRLCTWSNSNGERNNTRILRERVERELAAIAEEMEVGGCVDLVL